MEKFTWVDLRALGKTDNANRWYPNEDIMEYFSIYVHPQEHGLIHMTRPR